mmetsp:Transcript_13743/g.27115  ORF Transcript_13743/g.27115 Transcript_13743/m.27115 type:complete len:142 (-) Transcript_13743:1117-1542(-)
MPFSQTRPGCPTQTSCCPHCAQPPSAAPKILGTVWLTDAIRWEQHAGAVAGEEAPMPRAVAQGVRGVDGLSNCLEGVQLLVGVRKGVATLVIVTIPLEGVGVYTRLRRGVLGLASPKASRSSGPQSGEGKGIKADSAAMGV